jgi:hypothetical protein
MSGKEIAAGFFALSLGVVAFIVGNTQVQELQTVGGQLARGLSEDYQQRFLMFRIVRAGGAVLALVGIGGMVVGAYNSTESNGGGSNSKSRTDASGNVSSERSNSRDRSGRATAEESNRKNVVDQRDERRLVGVGSSRHFVVDIDHESTLEYTAKVIDGPPINVVLVEGEHLNEYIEHGDSKRIEEGTAIGVTEASERVRLRPGEYGIVLDNFGQVGPQNPQESAEVSITYSVTRH